MRFAIVAAVAAFAAAAPAAAQNTTADTATFTGPRIGLNIGIADPDHFLGTEAFTYGAEAGYDADLGGAVVGGSVELQDSDDTGRDISVSARIGAKVGSKGLIYVTGGYTNLKVYGYKLDGARIGVGGELALGRTAFVKLEQRYSNYELGAEAFQTVLGVGVRF